MEDDHKNKKDRNARGIDMSSSNDTPPPRNGANGKLETLPTDLNEALREIDELREDLDSVWKTYNVAVEFSYSKEFYDDLFDLLNHLLSRYIRYISEQIKTVETELGKIDNSTKKYTELRDNLMEVEDFSQASDYHNRILENGQKKIRYKRRFEDLEERANAAEKYQVELQRQKGL